jgi:hypothetical protein
MSRMASMGAVIAALLLTTSLHAGAQTTPVPSEVEFQPVEAPAPAQAPPALAPLEPATPYAEVRALVASARTDDAVLRCDRLLKGPGAAPPRPSVRQICAYALTAHGDRIYALGSLKEAKILWARARTLQPELSLDPTMAVRANLLSTGAVLPPMQAPMQAPKPAPKPAVAIAPSQPTCAPCPACPQPPVKPTLCPEAPPCACAATALDGPAPGPRADRGLGLGLGFGFDGLASLVVGWMHDEFLSIEASVGLVFPTLDARVRFYGMRTLVTPVFGVGMLTPFGTTDHFNADIQAGFPELYGHGTAVHIDLGASYAPWPALDLYAGVSFLTTLDGEVEMLVFFPHWSAQAVLYF